MFDIIGPSMVGPSSSHTAGANRIGQLARQVLGSTPREVGITLYGSFAETYQGHGTDRALIAGLMGMKTDDLRIRDALQFAEEQQIQFDFQKGAAEGIHPNSVRMHLRDEQGNEINLVGISIGGGSIEIIELNGYNIRFSGDYPTLLIEHLDQVGVIRIIGDILAKYRINVCHMEVDRRQRGGQAVAVVEMDEVLSGTIIHELEQVEPIRLVKQLGVV